jgi:anti-sigma regulatory factor (Ser/Thr protein kinase)
MRSNGLTIPVSESTAVGAVRRAAQEMAESLGFDETAKGRVSIVANELSTNLIKHAKNGRILIRSLILREESALEFLAIDSGPGIVDIPRALQDGYSTAGSHGNGMGAICRLSTIFDIYSRVDQGTVVVSQIRNGPVSVIPKARSFCLGAVNLPVKGETECGDSWAIQRLPDKVRMIVADGLGHGPKAAEASRSAIEVFNQLASASLQEIYRVMHGALRSTRGAAVAICELNIQQKEIRFAGIGNISGLICLPDSSSKHFVSTHGTVGQQILKLQEFQYPWEPGALLFLYSDGLQTRWNLEKCPGISSKHPSLIAGVLYRDFNRGNDDTTILVGMER